MNIQILFFGITTDLIGKTTMQYQVENHTTIKELKTALKADYMNLKNIHDFAIAVNECYAEDDLVIEDGDVVAIIPPVSGG